MPRNAESGWTLCPAWTFFTPSTSAGLKSFVRNDPPEYRLGANHRLDPIRLLAVPFGAGEEKAAGLAARRLAADLVSPARKLALNSQGMFSEPGTHLLIGPGPLEGMSVPMVVFWPRSQDMRLELLCYTAVADAGKRADRIARRLLTEVVEPLVTGAGRLVLAVDSACSAWLHSLYEVSESPVFTHLV